MKNILLLIICLLIASCVSKPTKQAPQIAPVNVHKLYDDATKEYKKGQVQSSLKKLNTIIVDYPNSELTQNACIMSGNIYMEKKEYEKAYQSYLKVSSLSTYSEREAESLYLAGLALHRMGRKADVLIVTTKALGNDQITDDIKLKTLQLRLAAFSPETDQLEILKTSVLIAGLQKNEAAELTTKQAIEYVQTRLSDELLEKVADDKSFGFTRGFAMYRLGKKYMENRQYNTARSYLSDAKDILTDPELVSESRRLIEQMDQVKKVEPKTIGLVIPLTGKLASVGYKTLHGVQLGLGIYGKKQGEFRLAVIDSEGNPDLAKKAIERLVTEDHVIGIIGSLLTKTAVSVATKSQELGVPNIALNQQPDITHIGNTVFRNSITSEMQMRFLVDKAMNQYKFKRFAIVYPNDPYGVELANAFWDEVISRGGEIRAAQVYSDKETDFRTQIQRIVGTFYEEERVEEQKKLMKEWLEKNKSTRQKPPEEILPPIADFDAVFIPDSAKAAGQIAAMLQYNDVTDATLLGPNLWNTPSLVERGGKYIEGALFVDAYQSGDNFFLQSDFYKSFLDTFNETPGVFELQAYDAALILRKLIEDGANSRESLLEKLSQLQKFPGALGPLSVSTDREIERPISLLTVQKGQIISVHE